MWVLRGGRKRPRWTDRDRLLLLAWDLYEDELCSGCGQPRTRSMNPDMAGWYEVKALTCHACAALDEHRDTPAAKIHGRKPVVFDVRPADDPAPVWMPDFGLDDDALAAAPDSAI